jgi:hypothetical protein
MNKFTLIALVCGLAAATKLHTPFMTDEEWRAEQVKKANNKELTDTIDDDHLVQLNPDSATYCKYERNVANTQCVAKSDNTSDCTAPDVFPTNKTCSSGQLNSLVQLNPDSATYCKYERNVADTQCVAKSDNTSDCTAPDVFPTNKTCSGGQLNSLAQAKAKDTEITTVVYCLYTRNTETSTCVANTDVLNCTPLDILPTNATCTNTSLENNE